MGGSFDTREARQFHRKLMAEIVSIDKHLLIQDSIQVLGSPGWSLSAAPRWLPRTIFPGEASA